VTKSRKMTFFKSTLERDPKQGKIKNFSLKALKISAFSSKNL